jgi:chromosome segregation ATPase
MLVIVKEFEKVYFASK